MRLMPDAKQGRVLAVVLLLIALILIYLVGVHWWFVAPLSQYRQEMIDLREEEARFRAIAQQRDAIREALAQVREFESSNPGFLTEANFDLAASGLIQRLQEQVDVLQAGDRCSVVSRTPFRGNAPGQGGRGSNTSDSPFERVTVKVRLRCEMEHFGPLLYGLESGSPQLFVSELTITGRRAAPGGRARSRNQPANAGYLDIAFDMYGYLRRAPGGGA